MGVYYTSSMATTFRLSGLSIFLLLLAVILIGYLLNYTWETFVGCGCGKGPSKEGFGTLGNGYGTIVDGYSTNGKQVVELYDGSKIYFDPVAKNFLETLSATELRITDRNNNAEDYTYSADTIKVIDYGSGGFKNIDISSTMTVISTTTVSDIKKAFNDLSITPHTQHFVEMDLSGAYGDDTVVKSATTYTLSGEPMLSQTSLNAFAESNMVKDSTKTGYHRLARVFDASNYVVKDPPTRATDFVYVGDVVQGQTPKYAFLHIPIKKDNNALTPVTFIHVMDLQSNPNPKHVKTFYFKGSDVEEKVINEKILASGHTELSELKGNNDDDLDFATKMEDDMKALPDGDFEVDVRHLTGDEAIKIVARKKETVGYSQFRALLTFTSGGKPILSKIQTGDSGHDSSYNSDDKDDFIKKMNEYKSLQASLFGFSEMRSPFYDYDGSPYTDFILKSEVVPPVCPSCPSCPNKGVCTNCGGNGGSGTNGNGGNGKDSASSLARDFGSGVDNFIRDGADGTTNIARDVASGAYGVAKETVSGATDLAKDAASGTGEFVQSSASGIGEYAKDAASGVYGAASDVVGGTVGLGREVVGGTFNAASNVAGTLAQAIPNYGSPNPNMNGAGPSTQMGGYSNSYGGGYMNAGGQPGVPGQDPYSYFGAVPPRSGIANYMPVTADFSAFK